MWSEDPAMSELVPRDISGIKMLDGQTGPPEAVYMEEGSF